MVDLQLEHMASASYTQSEIQKGFCRYRLDGEEEAVNWLKF